VVKNKENV